VIACSGLSVSQLLQLIAQLLLMLMMMMMVNVSDDNSGARISSTAGAGERTDCPAGSSRFLPRWWSAAYSARM